AHFTGLMFQNGFRYRFTDSWDKLEQVLDCFLRTSLGTLGFGSTCWYPEASISTLFPAKHLQACRPAALLDPFSHTNVENPRVPLGVHGHVGSGVIGQNRGAGSGIHKIVAGPLRFRPLRSASRFGSMMSGSAATLVFVQ